MCLGASRVAGDKPNHESFRYELWKDLIENNWTFDFIGTQTDAASYSMFNNRNFDIDHEGRSGYTSSQILNNITNWIAVTGVPDIVLFSSPGGNDGLQNLPYQQTISNIKAIVALLQQANPTITIVIEQLAPARSDIMSVELTNYFNQLLEDVLTIASENTTTSSQVIAVDMFTNFTDNLLADDVHYNTAGANFIADRYYTLLKTILEK
jgi:lysophospholipase L1-like esterase